MSTSEHAYPLVYSDPGWEYRDAKRRGAAANHYRTSSLVELAAVHERFAAKHCVMFMWATWPTLEDAFLLAKACGYKWHTCGFLWVKTTKHGKVFWGGGGWSRANTEPCLIFSRGSRRPRVRQHNVHQLIFDVVRDHSVKPPETRDRIVDMFGPRKRIELFARQRTEGWSVFGDEVGGYVPAEAA